MPNNEEKQVDTATKNEQNLNELEIATRKKKINKAEKNSGVTEGSEEQEKGAGLKVVENLAVVDTAAINNLRSELISESPQPLIRAQKKSLNSGKGINQVKLGGVKPKKQLYTTPLFSASHSKDIFVPNPDKRDEDHLVDGVSHAFNSRKTRNNK